MDSLTQVFSFIIVNVDFPKIYGFYYFLHFWLLEKRLFTDYPPTTTQPTISTTNILTTGKDMQYMVERSYINSVVVICLDATQPTEETLPISELSSVQYPILFTPVTLFMNYDISLRHKFRILH